MVKKINPSFDRESYWSKAWIRHIKNYLKTPPRCGYWLEFLYPKKYKMLEIAGGSCRDSKYLAKKGYSIIGSDFDEKTLSYLREELFLDGFELSKEDAFDFSFKSNKFDLTFSNGFWVLFENDDDITSLIKEQKRITKKYLISFVHNYENKKLLKLFKEKSLEDDLYNIRFFSRNELENIIIKSGISYKSISFNKFGGLGDKLLSNKIKKRSASVSLMLRKLVPFIYRVQPWSMVERIVVIVELN